MKNSEISITFNGKAEVLVRSQSLHEFLESKNLNKSYFAVAINREFVPRNKYSTFLIQNEDCIEVLAPMQGG